MVKGGYSLSLRRMKNSQLKRQKSVAIHLSLTLMRVKLVIIIMDIIREITHTSYKIIVSELNGRAGDSLKKTFAK